MGWFGIFFLVFIGWLLCKDKKSINWKTIIVGTLLQFIIALVVLKTSIGRGLFSFLNGLFLKMLAFSSEGSRFVFGDLASPVPPWNFVFAFQVLTTIIFFSSLMQVFYYLGVMQWVVLFFARIMNRFMGTSGAESLSCSANIFVGLTEAPLVVRPYISEMTESELHAVMVG